MYLLSLAMRKWGRRKASYKKVPINKYRRNEKNRKSLGKQLLQVRSTEIANISEWMFEDKLDICITSKGKLGEGCIETQTFFVATFM